MYLRFKAVARIDFMTKNCHVLLKNPQYFTFLVVFLLQHLLHIKKGICKYLNRQESRFQKLCQI